MAGGVGHTGGLTNPHPWRGRCRAGYSNTGGPPLPRKRAPLQKKTLEEFQTIKIYQMKNVVYKNLNNFRRFGHHIYVQQLKNMVQNT